MQALLEVGQAGQIAVACLFGGRARGVETGGLGTGRARGLAQLGQLLGHSGQLGVGLVQREQGGLDVAPQCLGAGA